MTRRRKIIFICVPAAIALLIFTPMCCRYRANVRLGRELRKEADAWLATLPTIPESENGAPIIIKALEQFNDFYETFNDSDPSIESETVAATLRLYLSQKKEAFELLEKGLTYKKWAFTTDYEKGYEATIPNLLWLKYAGKAFALKGDIARIEGRNSDALKEYLNVLRLASTLSGERLLISHMIYFSVCYIGLRRIGEFVRMRDHSEQRLSHVLEELIGFNKKRVKVSVAYETEYFAFTMIVLDILEGKTTMRAAAMVGITGQEQEKEEESDAWEAFVTSRWMYDYGEDVEIYRRWRERCQEFSPERYYDRSEDFFDVCALFGSRLGKPRAILAQVALPSLKGYQVETVSIAMFRGTILLTAIRLYQARNGVLPESLDQLGELVSKELLTDPFSGKNIIYRREKDDFYLYSVGFNGVDDKCKDSKPVYEKDVDIDEVPDIIFHAPAGGK